MNTQTQEALKMAIEALEFFQKNSEFWKDTVEEAIQACKEALAQPAQEPVAWIDEFGNCEFTYAMWMKEEPNVTWIPVYTHSAPSWQGLSDDEVTDLANFWDISDIGIEAFIDKVVRKSKEKNHERQME